MLPNQPNFDPAMMEKMQRMLSENPEIARLIQKPGMMQKLQAIASNPNDPTIARSYAADPDVQRLISLMNGTGMGAGAGLGANQNNAPQGYNIGGSYGPQGGQGHGHGQAQYNNSGGGGGGGGGNLVHISSVEQFDRELKTTKLVVCDFFAVWCGPCKVIAPDFERFAKFYKQQAVFLKIDVDKNSTLARKLKISAMPTFHFYKGGQLLEEFRGANVNKLESLINKYIHTDMSTHNQNSSMNDNQNKARATPYQNMPLNENNRPIYTKAPFAKMINKLTQLNDKFKANNMSKNIMVAVVDKNQNENHNDTFDEHNDHNQNEKKKKKKKSKLSIIHYAMSVPEWNTLQEIIALLTNKAEYHNTRFEAIHVRLIREKLLEWPTDSLPIVLDLIRVFVLHPNAAEYMADNFAMIEQILAIGGNGLRNAVNAMLTCKIIINLFNRRTTAIVLEQNLETVVNYLWTCMKAERKNTRLAFIRVLLCFSYNLFVAGIKNKTIIGDKIRLLSILTQCLTNEMSSDNFNDTNVILNCLMAIGTNLYDDANVCCYARNILELELLLRHIKQLYGEANLKIMSVSEEILAEIELKNKK